MDGWREHFAPVIRRAGFKGSGQNFRRAAGDFVQVVNLQGSRGGGKFAVNLGLQPLAIPDVAGRVVDPAAIKECECEFRGRLTETGADQWWSYSTTKASIEGAALSAARLFEAIGLPLFEELSAPDSPILTITAAQFADQAFSIPGLRSSKPRTAQTLALLRLAQGKEVEARLFAKLAVDLASSQMQVRPEIVTLAGAG